MLEYITKTVQVKQYEGTEEELQTAIASGAEIVNFQGGFEVDESKLDELVPYHFFGLTDTDAETKEPISTDRTWRTYARSKESINEGKALIECHGFIADPSNMSCQGVIKSVELHKWIAELGAENIHTKSHWEALKKQPDISEI